MTRLAVLLCLLLASTAAAAGPEIRATAHITSQTTTALVAAVASQSVSIYGGSICVDANGATTGITIVSSAGTNLVGTGMVYVLGAGQCLWLPTRQAPYYTVTASGTGLSLITTVGNGPVEVNLEVVQR
jgi:hypothetical protein